MEAIERREQMRVGGIALRLYKTDIPQELLRRWLGHPLILPTSARLLLQDSKLIVQMIKHNPEEYGDEYYEPPEFDDNDPPIATLQLDRPEIIRLTIGGRLPFRGALTAVLFIKDPWAIVENLSITFTSHDANNPHYMIMGFAKMLRERLNVDIEEVSEPGESFPPF